MSHDTRTPEVAAPARRFSAELPSTRRGAQRARLLTVAQLGGWGLPHDAAAHVVAELAANAALHGRVPGRNFRLTLEITADRLRIEVTDTRGERLPAVPRPGEPDDESGRGLLLVTALAARWGVTSGPFPSKTVWAEVELPEPSGASAPETATVQTPPRRG
ncbi:ATP-binding protein [Actinacidiphila paucisporea]|uniref:Anti-sigma regulatory factor (Ser/Thr protein kinase) n=1 Tax=Actinacidiphila paucisporea TaxID=310782 RepID=A0A1M6TQH1_9ACTN|nr:ATP-binding protein [Actinacidiphila paucisporea]SHK59163.1 Anti-sigma regulatory factor (Ser/Thr protein kinase) [Actinacidiphila paucisporea]